MQTKTQRREAVRQRRLDRVSDSRGKVAPPPGFEKVLSKRRSEAIAAGNEPPCECWDCLRRDGLTPPLRLRGAHAGRYPHRVYDADPGGEPYAKEKKREDGEVGGSHQQVEDHAHLREAVRNREAI